MGRYCIYLLPRQVDGTFQILVNGRLQLSRMVTLYVEFHRTYLRVKCVEQHDQLLVYVLDGRDDDIRHIPRIISNGALPCVPQPGDEAR